MLTSIGRAAARRTICGRATPSTSALTKAAAPRYPSLHAALPLRTFTVSAWSRLPTSAAKDSAAKDGEAKPKTPKKTATTKAAKPKAKAKVKAKKPKKAAPKKKKKATPEQKEMAELRETKKMALLKGPDLLPATAWAVYVSNNVLPGQGTLSEKIKGVSSSFKTLSSSELDQLQATSEENKLANQDTRRAWVDSHPPEAIYLANLARRRLAKKLGKSRLFLIHDDRQPKRALTPYILFIKARYPKMQVEGSAQDTIRSMGAEWKTLSDADKLPYQDMAAAESGKSREALKDLKEKAKVYWAAQMKGGAAAENQSSYPSP